MWMLTSLNEFQFHETPEDRRIELRTLTVWVKLLGVKAVQTRQAGRPARFQLLSSLHS